MSMESWQNQAPILNYAADIRKIFNKAMEEDIDCREVEVLKQYFHRVCMTPFPCWVGTNCAHLKQDTSGGSAGVWVKTCGFESHML